MAASQSECALPLPANGAQPPALPAGAARGRPAGRSAVASRAQGRESGRILHLPPGPPGRSRCAMERAYAASCRAASAPVGATAASSAAAPAAPRQRTKGLKSGGGGEDSTGGLGTSGSSSPALRRRKASGRTKKGWLSPLCASRPHSATQRREEARLVDVLTGGKTGSKRSQQTFTPPLLATRSR